MFLNSDLNPVIANCKTSVVIPCFNHGEFLGEAVNSVLDIKRGDVEVIVVDDGSTDERTCREMETLAARGIRVLRQQNKGVAAARNAGILASSGEYILPLDADNRLRPAYIERGIEILDACPDVGVVYGDAQYIGLVEGRWAVGCFDLHRLLRRNYIDACAIYRRSIWEQNAGYDPGMPVQGWEDWDFWLGAVEHGWRLFYVQEILFEYRRSADSMITRTKGFERQLGDFVSKKHGLLYQKAWYQLDTQQRSLRWSFHHLIRVLRSRVIKEEPQLGLWKEDVQLTVRNDG